MNSIFWIIYIENSIIVFLFGLLGHFMRKKKIKENELSKIYFYDRTKKKTFLNGGALDCSKIICFVTIDFVIAVFSVWIGEVGRVHGFWNDCGKYVENLPSIMMATTVTVVTFLGVIRAWNKRDCLIFDMGDILEDNKITEKIKYIMLLTIASYVALLFSACIKNIVPYSIFFMIKSQVMVLFICYMYFWVRIIWFTIEVFCGTSLEQKMLDKLYMVFNYSNIPEKNYDSTIDKITGHMEYLINGYYRYYKGCGLNGIGQIIFGTNLDLKQTRYKKVRFRSAFIILTIIGFLEIMFIFEGSRDLWRKYLIIVVMQIVLIWIIFMKWIGMTNVFIEMIYGISGYEILYKYKCISLRYVSDTKFFENKVLKFLRNAKSIAAYFYICLKIEENKAKEIERIIKNEYEKENTLGIVLLIIDYLYYIEKGGHIVEKNIFEKVPDIYKKIAEAILMDIKGEAENENIKIPLYEKYLNDFISKEVTEEENKKTYIVTVQRVD